MENICLGTVMSLIALLCFISSFHQKQIIGYRGLCLFVRNKRKKDMLYKISNRIFAVLLLVSSTVYMFISLIAYGDNSYSRTIVIPGIIYIVLTGIMADILAFTIMKKSGN